MLICGDSNIELDKFEENSIDSFVTDPPYGIRFMNNKWDYDVPKVSFWKKVFRVLKPGGHALVFCGTRTQHRMVTNIEDAGFEIRDVLSWLYGQGFPKSLNIAKQIDTQLKYGKVGSRNLRKLEQSGNGKPYTLVGKNHGILGEKRIYDRKEWSPESEEAKLWEGWGTALKPGCEFITLVRKPISERNIALNVLKWGVGGINIDATRIELNGEIVPINKLENWSGFGQEDRPNYTPTINTKGRWPANVILDEESGAILDNQTGTLKSGKMLTSHKRSKTAGVYQSPNKIYGKFNSPPLAETYGDSGGASRFFYCAKPSQKEKGLDNYHQTVKPIALMEFLVKLITPIKGVCCDPFMGSGSTVVACKKLGYDYIGIEKEPEFFTIAEKRIKEI